MPGKRTKLLLLLSLNLLNACTVTIPNSKLCAVSGVLAAGMDCAYTLTDETHSMTLDETVAFLEPTEARGAAVCMSAVDFTKLKTAMEQACEKLRGCNKEVETQIQQMSGRVEALQTKVKGKRRKT